jgi:hypothetical protein
MADHHPSWQRLVDSARQVPEPTAPALPADFADEILARLPLRADHLRTQSLQRLVLCGAVAASLLALAFGLWNWDAVSAELAQAPPGLENVMPLESVP